MLKLKVRKHGSEFKELLLEPGREYTVGRAPQCDVVLDDLPGISRQHFKIQYIDDVWQVQVLSKFGNLTKDGDTATSFTLSAQDAFKLAPYDFVALEDVEPIAEAHSSADQRNESKALALISQDPPDAYDENFQGDNEITSVGAFIGVPYLRISAPEKQDEVLRLEGKAWVAGRDENCSVVLKDATASRKQFRIDYEDENYFISDVGSSNGTLLNGARIKSKTQIKSGDIVSVQSLTIHFEIRDPNFKERMQGISENFINSPALIIEKEPAYQYPNFMPTGYSGDGGAIALHSHYPPSQQPQKNKKLFIYGGIAIAIIFALFMFSGNSKKADPNAQNISGNANKFEHLSSAQKQLVVDSYNLANNFLLQGKYANAQAQLLKVAEILGDEPYMDSRNLMAACQRALDNESNIANIESQRKRADENARRLAEILFRCKQVSETSTSEQAIDHCLEEAINLDPSSPEIAFQKEKVRKRVTDLNDRASQKANDRQQVMRVQQMYNHARSLEASGDLLQAIDAYKKLTLTRLHDPENRRKEAQRKIASIEQSISQKADQYVRASLRFKEQNNLKAAIIELRKAQKIDVNNSRINATAQKYRVDLDAQLQELFGQATIYEGNSRIERAIELWRNIITLDTPDGEYSRKSKSKLKLYGSR